MTTLPTLADVGAAATHCSYCPKMCRFTCPVAGVTGREAVNPWGIDREIAAVAPGFGAGGAGAAAPGAATADAVYACTGCRACATACLPGLDLPTHVRAARAAVVAAGLAPEGLDAESGRRTPTDDALRAGATPGADVVVYPGCRSEDGAATAALLAAVGIDYDVVDAATCCGARSVDVGYPEEGLALADELARALEGAGTVLVADPHCARFLGVDRDDARVVTLSRYLAGAVGRLADDVAPAEVVWHDPCWLARGLGEQDEPRALLAASGTVVREAERHGDRTFCTGGGMGLPATHPGAAAAMAEERAEELDAAGPGLPVVTGCPTAASRLRAAGRDAYDLAAWLARRLEEAGNR